MKRMLVVLATVVMVILSLPLVSFGLNFSSLGTATVDGKMSPGEWDRAAKLDFQVNIPTSDGGGTAPATLYIMNDESNIYFALILARPSFGQLTNFVVDFDNNNNGIAEAGDDGIKMYVGAAAAPTFADWYRLKCPNDPAGTANCFTYDTNNAEGSILPAGTDDGNVSASNDGSYTVIEVWHPLSSADTLHDFSLKVGSRVGFMAKVNLKSSNYTARATMDAETIIPVSGSTSGYGQITIASAFATITRAIDIKPGGGVNSINSKSEGKIPVAILSTREFDAPASVDRASLTFGRTGDERSLAFCNSAAEDVNGDGLFDLLCHFTTPDTGLQAGDTAGILKGRTTDGSNFTGKDSVRIVR